MTRRDRAAMELALACLRGSKVGGLSMARDALRFADCDPYLPPMISDAEAALDDTIDAAMLRGDLEWHRRHYALRDMLRARLALYLRAVLRVDAIEREDWWPTFEMRTRITCAGCGEVIPGYARGEETSDPCPRTSKIEVAHNARPLWELAPEHRP